MGGQLLIVVGRDPNDQYFPLAFGVVVTETKETWRWFIDLLMGDIGLEKRYVLLSDQQKGLVFVFEEMNERVEHRLCLRHLYANFKNIFGWGALIRDLMMGAAKATYYQGWLTKMNELKEVDKKARSWLMEVPPKSWCKHAFSFYPKCDVIMNNIFESFNATILAARDKPILTMSEWIKKYLMNRCSTSVLKLEKWPHKVMPIPRKRLDHRVIMSGQWHVVATLGFRQQTPEDFVDDCYSREKYKLCYGFAVSPINGHDMWPESCKSTTQDPNGLKRKKKVKTQPTQSDGDVTTQTDGNENGASQTDVVQTGASQTDVVQTSATAASQGDTAQGVATQADASQVILFTGKPTCNWMLV
ncbi:uncharacterized protein LOC131637122 [Vicia villosa]|uniref:uncharacterized protein LOC131637122 n=1 Tax=Vicia villosa TaxID=3911 RepID=UPI00273BCC43|nr:uncharacterized protein LOC131637122 [Vicia villosa]